MTVEVALLTESEAQRLTEGIRSALDRTSRGMADLSARVSEAYQRRADLALGYESWADYAQAEFGEQTEALAAPIRRELVGYLSAEGMSTRAIAPAVNKDHSTVSRDVKRSELLQHATAEPAAPVERTVIIEQRHVDIETGEIIEPTPDPEPVPAPAQKVTGLDGKTYTRKEPKTPRRRSLVDDAYTANRELYKAIERVRDIQTDDRYQRNKADIQVALQPSIDLALEVISDLKTL